MNWTLGSDTSFAGFEWGPTTSYGSPVPSRNGNSMNLNALRAGTTYYYAVTGESTCGAGSTTDSGSFTTSGAPTNGFLGWVSQLVSDPYQLDQVGSTVVSGATVSVGANCGSGGDPFYIPAATTDGSGYYAFTFPISYSQQGGTFTWTLSSSGVCNYAIAYVGSWNTANSHYLLRANMNGLWNATDYVSSTLSATNDFVQFGLESNSEEYARVGAAWTHTSLATCSVEVENGWTQSISAYLAGNGFNDIQSGSTVVWANPVSNGVSEVDFHYMTTGVMNETGGAQTAATYAYGPEFDPSSNAVSPSDQYGNSPPAGSQVFTVGPSGGGIGWENGGSYTFTSGLAMSISLSGGWDGASAGPSVDLSYTTSTGSTSSNYISCPLTDPSLNSSSGNYDAQFWFFADGGSVGPNTPVINAHIWFDDFCLRGSSPSCT